MLGVAARSIPCGDREGEPLPWRLLLRFWKGEVRKRDAKDWEGEAFCLLRLNEMLYTLLVCTAGRY